MIALTSLNVSVAQRVGRVSTSEKKKTMVPHQLFLFHALHQDNEQMLGLRATVGERLLDGD